MWQGRLISGEESCKQAVVLLATHMYESRDASTAGVFANSAGAAEQTWRAIHRLLLVDKIYVEKSERF